jgi:hypothetical protein
MGNSISVFVLVLIAVTVTAATHAAPYTPRAADEIIAQWPVLNNDTQQKAKTAAHLQPHEATSIIALANYYLTQAAQPGQSRLYGLAQAALKPLIESNSDNKDVWLAWAQVQQHQHHFLIAQQALQKVLQKDPTNTSANLLAARIYVIQEKPLAARNACLTLLGSSDLLTVTACSLEANTYLHPDQLNSSYQQLKILIDAQGLPSDERGSWLIQVLADMAVRNNDPSAAAGWLAQRLEKSSVNYLAQWADVQFLLNQPEQVLRYLTQLVTHVSEIDDALLLRLAVAEKKINSTNNLWQSQLAERVVLREQRQDTLHANELAIYYLDIDPLPEKALAWANINFASAREYSDKNLLARAQQFNRTKDTQ